MLAGLFAVGLLANTGIPVLAGNSGATKGSGTWTKTGSVNTAALSIPRRCSGMARCPSA